MKQKHMYFLRGSLALLLFLSLGFLIKYNPDQLTQFDSQLQAGLRGNLPPLVTTFFQTITQLANVPVIASWVALVFIYFFFIKKWKAEAALLLGSLVVSGGLVTLIKPIFARPRPSITHLVVEHGYSFPSGHSLASTMVFGALLIIVHQAWGKRPFGKVLEILLALLIPIIMVSRVYLGVHYPSDVTAGFLLGFTVLQFVFPFYKSWPSSL